MIRSQRYQKLLIGLIALGTSLAACREGSNVDSSPVSLDATYWRVAGGRRPGDFSRMATRPNRQKPFDPSLLRADTNPVWRLNMTQTITSTPAIIAAGASSNAADRLILEGAGVGDASDPAHYIGVVSNFTSLTPSMKSPAIDSGLDGGAILVNLDGSIAYAVSSAGTVYAISTSDASIVWTASLPGGHSWATSWLDFPTNLLFVPDLSGAVTALNADTGAQIWQTPAIAGAGIAIHSSPLVYNNIVWVGADNGSLYKLNATTGAAIGSPINLCVNTGACNTADQIWSGPTIDTNQNQLILGVSKRLIRVDMNLNTFVATVLDSGSYISTAARFYTSLYLDNPSGGYAYFGYNNRLWRAAYNGTFSTLQIATTPDFAGLLRGVNVDEGYPRGIPIVFNGQIFLGDGGGFMHRFDASTFAETAVKSFVNPGATQNGPVPAIDSTALVDFTGGNCYFAVANPNSPEGAQIALDQNFTSDNSTNNSATTHLAVTTSVSSTAPGTPFHITVTALDSNNNVTTGYTGTVHFTSSDMQAVLPADYAFTPAVNGSVTFYNAASLSTPGVQSITATDTITASITGVTNVTVTAASTATHFQVTPSTPSPTVGAPFSLTVTALDAFNNVVAGYTGTAHFTSTDGTATLPADYTFVAGDNGVHSFTNGATLNTTGSQSITVTDTVAASITGSTSVTVGAGGANHFSIATSTSTPAQGEAFHLFITVLDAQNNPVTGYTGTVHFTSTDGQAILPADYTFSGSYSTVSLFYSTSLHTIGSQTITATDTGNNSIQGTSSALSVGGGPTAGFTITPDTSAPGSGAPFNVSVTAVDAYGNPTPSYVGTIHFTSSDSAMGVSLPSDYTFVSGDNGTHSFSVTLITGGSQTVTATDTVTASFTGSANVTVGGGAAASYDLSASVMSVPQGTVFHLFIRALDGNGVPAANYGGTAHFTTSDPAGVVPADFTFTPGYPATSLFYQTVLDTPGVQTITATDTVTGSIIGTVMVTVTSSS